MSFRLAAITDEFSPDLETAAHAMREAGLQGAELRMVYGKNVADLSDEEIDRAVDIVRGHGLEIVCIASPLLKCVLPGGPEVEARLQRDVFASAHGFEDQAHVARRTFEIAKRAEASIIRVFSYWRTVRPQETVQRVAEALEDLAADAWRHGITIGLENEHACNVATGHEIALVFAAAKHPNLKVVWDPANALVAGENPFPDGYRALPRAAIGHVHAKDCRMENGAPVWVELGQGVVDWKGQLAALASDGYKGWISLETHWPGPGGHKLKGSEICAQNLMRLVAEAAGSTSAT